MFENYRICGGRFLETALVAKNYYIQLVEKVVVAPGTRDATVEGPRIRWTLSVRGGVDPQP